MLAMASMLEAIEIKRKTYFEYEGAPYHCLDVEVSKPTARGGQTLVRIKMRNMITQAVFDRTFKAGDKFNEPDLAFIWATYLYADASGYNFMDQRTFDTITLSPEIVGDDKFLLVDNLLIQIHTYNDKPLGLRVSAARRDHRDVDRGGRARRHGERQRHQDREARDRHGNSRPAVHQGGREDQGPHRDRASFPEGHDGLGNRVIG